MADIIARAMAAQAKATAVGTTNGETVDARTGADSVARATLGALVREMHQDVINNKADLAAGNTSTAALVHGLNVINTSRASVVTPTISGRTISNLIGNVGRTGTSATAVNLDVAKYYVIINEDMSAVTVDAVSQAVPYKFTGKTTTALSWATGKVGLYEVTSGDYAKIGVDPAYSGAKILDFWPYVDNVKHIQAPMITKQGKNLLPPFTEWVLNANAVANSPYNLTLNTTGAGQDSTVIVPALPSTSYAFSLSHSGKIYVDSLRSDGTQSVRHFTNDSAQTFTFTTSADARSIKVFVGSGALITGTLTFTNPQLELGSAATAFEPQNIDYLYGVADSAGKPLVLASNVDGTVKDSLFYRDGAWRKEKRWVTDVVLDGALTWAYHSDGAGFKRITTGQPGYVNDKAIASKFNGASLLNNLTAAAIDSFALNTAYGGIILGIPDTDTGFGETYTALAQEISAYFNGWKANAVDGNGKPTSWVSIVDGTTSPTTNTLAYVSANKAPNYTPYKLSYQLATTVEEVATIEGAISLHPGGNQIEVSEGVIVREKVTPFLSSGVYYINAQNVSANLKNRASRIVTVYKNGFKDNAWTVGTAGTQNGTGTASTTSANFDATAEYTVTYTMMDKYAATSAPTDVSVEYNTTLKTTVDHTVKRLADVETTSSINVRAIAELYKRVKALGG